MKRASGALAATRRLLAGVRRLFTPLALVCLMLAGYAASDTVQTLLPAANPARLAVVVVAWAALQALVPALAAVLLRGLGAPIGYRAALHMHLSRLPARYLPGGIWQTVARASDLQALGVSKPTIVALVAMENLIPLSLALLLGAALSLAGPAPGAPLLVVAWVGGGVLAAQPWLLARLAPALRLSGTSYVQAAAVSAAFWLLAATVFALYWSAFPVKPEAAPTTSVMGAYLLSWAAGLVAVFAPQGIGVFEVVAAALLKGAMPIAGVAVLVAGFRAATLAGDAVAFGASVAVAAALRLRCRRGLH